MTRESDDDKVVSVSPLQLKECLLYVCLSGLLVHEEPGTIA